LPGTNNDPPKLTQRAQKAIFCLAVNLGLAVFSLVIFCLAAEFAMRFVVTGWKKSWDATENFKYEDNLRRRGPRKPIEYRRFYRKDPGTVRILVLGDSVTYGQHVASPEDIYTSILERRLNERYSRLYPGIKIEVVNLGGKGHTTFNEYEILETDGMQYKPDILIVQFFSNDTEVSMHGYKHILRFMEFGIKDKLLGDRPVHHWLLKHSYLYSFIDLKYFELLCRLRIPRGYGFDDDYLGWRQCKASLALISVFCRQNNIDGPFLMIFPMLIPGKWEVANFPERAIHDKVKLFAVNNGFTVLDLLPVFLAAKKDLQEFWALPLDSHPGKLAHLITALSLENLLLTSGVIDRRIQSNPR
jgi:hypothetical protein